MRLAVHGGAGALDRSRSTPERDDASREALRASLHAGWELPLLLQLFAESSTEDATGFIQQQRAKIAFEKLPLLDDVALDAASMLVVEDLSGDLHGQVGLPKAHKGLRQQAKLSLCSQHRMLASLVPNERCGLVAIVDDDTLALENRRLLNAAHPRVAELWNSAHALTAGLGASAHSVRGPTAPSRSPRASRRSASVRRSP